MKTEFEKENITNTLLEFVRSTYPHGKEDIDLLNENSDLYEEGYIDSIEFEKFISFIEDRFRITFDESHFFDNRFASIGGITEIIFEIGSKNCR